MKIDGQPTLAFISRPTDHNKPQTGFEQWINTPTGQHSGDEYYWLHQQQLQDSCLKFESKIQEPKHQRHAVDGAQKESTTFSAGILTHHFEPRLLPATSESVIPVNHTTHCQFSHQEHQTHYTQKQRQQAIPFMQLQRPNNQTGLIGTKEPKSLAHQAIPAPLKKHHLYIENDEVELSMNTQDLNPHEEQELRQMIHLNIKEKGFYLKQLLINGVKK